MTVMDLEDLASIALPTADEEIWRYSRIGELDLSAYHPVRATHQAQMANRQRAYLPLHLRGSPAKAIMK